MSRFIRIDHDVQEAILRRTLPEDGTPNDVLRRLVGLPPDVRHDKRVARRSSVFSRRRGSAL